MHIQSSRRTVLRGPGTALTMPVMESLAEVHVWLIVRAPQFGPTGVVSRDLVDMTDVVLTIVNLAELKHPAH